MKSKKYLALLGIGCGALLLTGCGGNAHTLTCEQSNDESEETVVAEIKFNDDETKVERVSVEMTLDASKSGEDVTEDQLEESKELLESVFCSEKEKMDKCEIKISGKKVVIKMSGTADAVGYEGDKTLEEFKKEAEEQEGMTCK
ncbi:MAG: hypothetical protein IJ568_06565 [Bacilli bacterium]|nr:hypothetical protein [Bacilli bacterium]